MQRRSQAQTVTLPAPRLPAPPPVERRLHLAPSSFGGSAPGISGCPCCETIGVSPSFAHTSVPCGVHTHWAAIALLLLWIQWAQGPHEVRLAPSP